LLSKPILKLICSNSELFVFQASCYPTVVVYVMDTARSTNPVTFMSNMLYACSILYKTKLPFIVVMNKVSIHGVHSLSSTVGLGIWRSCDLRYPSLERFWRFWYLSEELGPRKLTENITHLIFVQRI